MQSGHSALVQGPLFSWELPRPDWLRLGVAERELTQLLPQTCWLPGFVDPDSD